MEKQIHDNGKVRLTPTNPDNWLFDGGSSFGKVVDCLETNSGKWQEVTNSFKEEYESDGYNAYIDCCCK